MAEREYQDLQRYAESDRQGLLELQNEGRILDSMILVHVGLMTIHVELNTDLTLVFEWRAPITFPFDPPSLSMWRNGIHEDATSVLNELRRLYGYHNTNHFNGILEHSEEYEHDIGAVDALRVLTHNRPYDNYWPLSAAEETPMQVSGDLFEPLVSSSSNDHQAIPNYAQPPPMSSDGPISLLDTSNFGFWRSRLLPSRQARQPPEESLPASNCSRCRNTDPRCADGAGLDLVTWDCIKPEHCWQAPNGVCHDIRTLIDMYLTNPTQLLPDRSGPLPVALLQALF